MCNYIADVDTYIYFITNKSVNYGLDLILCLIFDPNAWCQNP